jgi:hypothetical protein
MEAHPRSLHRPEIGQGGDKTESRFPKDFPPILSREDLRFLRAFNCNTSK